MINAQSIVDEARRWIGTPYVHQGRTRFGVDCIGFAICVRNAVEAWPEGMQEIKNYSRRPKDGLLLSRVTTYLTSIRDVEQGSVILIRWPQHDEPSHVGIYADGNIIHAYAKSKQVIETGYRAHWLRDTHSIWRLPGVMP